MFNTRLWTQCCFVLTKGVLFCWRIVLNYEGVKQLGLLIQVPSSDFTFLNSVKTQVQLITGVIKTNNKIKGFRSNYYNTCRGLVWHPQVNSEQYQRKTFNIYFYTVWNEINLLWWRFSVYWPPFYCWSRRVSPGR